MLIDLPHLSDCACTDHLENLAKAAAEDGASTGESIWAPHENPWLTAHVEASTVLLQDIAKRIQEAVSKALFGEAIETLAKAEPPWSRWDLVHMEETKRYLESKDTAAYTLDDWLLMAEYIVHRYCPDNVISDLAQYITVRATLLGRIQAAARHNLTHPQIDDLVQLVPTLFAKVPPRILSPTERAILRVANARAGESIALARDSMKHRMKSVIIEHVQAQVLGQKEGTAAHLKTRLFDNFGTLNRDFRRIAVTEAGECMNQGVVAANLGGRLRRIEAYKGACQFCKSLNGREFDVVAADAPNKDGKTQVWEGKTNVGRSAAFYRKVDGKMVERAESERWWPAAGLQHPHCRGAWQPLVVRPANVSEEFEAWMDQQLAASIPGYKSDKDGGKKA